MTVAYCVIRIAGCRLVSRPTKAYSRSPFNSFIGLGSCTRGTEGTSYLCMHLALIVSLSSSLIQFQKVEDYHKRYGPIVRIGPNEVSVAGWQHLRSIYTSSKIAVKDPSFYQAASFIGKNNIFQMLYVRLSNCSIKLISVEIQLNMQPAGDLAVHPIPFSRSADWIL